MSNDALDRDLRLRSCDYFFFFFFFFSFADLLDFYSPVGCGGFVVLRPGYALVSFLSARSVEDFKAMLGSDPPKVWPLDPPTSTQKVSLVELFWMPFCGLSRSVQAAAAFFTLLLYLSRSSFRRKILFPVRF